MMARADFFTVFVRTPWTKHRVETTFGKRQWSTGFNLHRPGGTISGRECVWRAGWWTCSGGCERSKQPGRHDFLLALLSSTLHIPTPANARSKTFWSLTMMLHQLVVAEPASAAGGSAERRNWGAHSRVSALPPRAITGGDKNSNSPTGKDQERNLFLKAHLLPCTETG